MLGIDAYSDETRDVIMCEILHLNESRNVVARVSVYLSLNCFDFQLKSTRCFKLQFMKPFQGNDGRLKREREER